MSQIEQFNAQVSAINQQEGSATIRLMPYGQVIEHGNQLVTFDAGSLSFDKAPVNLDHGGNVLDHVGRVERFFETGDGAYAEIKFSDTAAGRDTRTLLLDGVIEDVSAGVLVDPSREFVDDNDVLHRFGSVHHVAIVRQGAFGSAGAGSKVLQVHAHNQGGIQVSDEKETTASTVVEHKTDAEVEGFRRELDQLRSTIAEMSVPGAVQARDPELSTGEILTAVVVGDNPELAARLGVDFDAHARNLSKIQAYALAKDNTTVGAGVVPAFAKSEVISIVDANRPINNVLRKTAIEQYGMVLNFPVVATKPSTALEGEHDEPSSTQIDINSVSLTLGTYAGASDVSIQLLERSMPSYLQVLYEEYAHVLATRTEIVASDALIAGAGGTAVLASLTTDAAATAVAVATRKSAILAGTRQPATHIILGTTRALQLESMLDTTDRPLLHYGDGSNSFGAQGMRFMGMEVVISPDATATDCILINANRSVLVAESAPQFFNIDIRGTSLSVQLGIYQYYGMAVTHAAGIQTLTPS
jgi:HK97 family phage major capsid protein